MRGLTIPMVGFMVLIATGCQRASRVTEADREAAAVAIQARYRTFGDAFSSEDMEGVKQFFVDDGGLTAYHYPLPGLVGWESLEAYWRAVFAQGRVNNLTFGDIGVVLLDPVHAVSTARWRFDYTSEAGSRAVQTGRITSVLEKQDGRWLTLHMHTSLDPTAVPAEEID